VRRRLAGPRLVTPTGPGGTGKTRLALQVAADALAAYPDGGWLVELGALADPALVLQAVPGAPHEHDYRAKLRAAGFVDP
jgi:predicted ATPase